MKSFGDLEAKIAKNLRMDDSMRTATNGGLSKKQLILEATESCIREYGANKVSINDIAARAGLGRMTVYRAFENRAAILEELVIQRVEIIARQVSAVLATTVDFDDAVIEGSMLTIRLSEEDEIWQSISENGESEQFDQLQLASGSLGEQLFFKVWNDTIARGRRENKIRDELSDQQIGDWLRSMQFLIMQRPDLDQEKKKQFLRRFALPALS